MVSVEVEKENGKGEAFFHGDILESILSYVPLVHLVPACHVSRSWNRAVFFSLRRIRIKPWILLYAQTRTPHYLPAATLAYDPLSRVWIEIKTAAPVEHVSDVRSTHSTLIYALSPSRFSFSVDPLHLTWRHVAAPRVWRIDPIVAAVGSFVVVAGGVCDFEDDGLAVELLDTDTGAWMTCESMPVMLKDSAASTWLSVASSSDKMYVVEKKSGMGYSFDPNTLSWTELFNLRPVRDNGYCDVYSLVIEFAGNRLIIAGITGDEETPTGIKLWEVTTEEVPEKFKLIGSMPSECLDKLVRGEDRSSLPLPSIALNAVGDIVCIHNPAEAGDIVTAEMVEGKLCNWRILRDPGLLSAKRWVVACSDVRFSDLRRGFRENSTFSLIA